MSLVPKRFRSAKLLMRPFFEGDAASVYAYASDPEVTRLMDWATHSDISMSQQFIQATKAEWERGSQFQWAITKQDTEQLIGAVSCGALNHRISFGYVLARSAWNRGFATEAARAMIQIIESLPGVARIWATCDTENLASANVLEKCGMEREGILRKWSIRPNLEGAVRDSYVYAKTRDA